jgi:cell division protein FtsZ
MAPKHDDPRDPRTGGDPRERAAEGTRTSGGSGQGPGAAGRGPGHGSRTAGPGASGGGFDLLEIGPEDGAELLEFEDSGRLQATIKVIGVGGGGGNALNTMIQSRLQGVEFIAANTDAQALEHNLATIKVQLGTAVTRGLGCGATPDKGRAAALEDRDRIRDMLTGADMVFVTAGLGGGTGTGAAPVIAEVAREVGALTVAVVTRPFQFEGKVRMRHAQHGLEELHRVVDTLITIPNHRLLALADKNTPIKDAFRLADEVLLNAVKGISDLITVHGLINLDFADVRTIMNEMGMALMGTGVARGENRASEAAHAAISSPLLEDLSIEGARGVLINVSAGSDMTLYDVNEAATVVQQAAHEDANIIFGAVIDESIPEGELRVTVIATGLDQDRVRRGEGGSSRRDGMMVPRPLRGEPRDLFEPGAPAARTGAPAQRDLPAFGQAEEPAGGDFVSPYDEDEFDKPAFLRKQVLEEDDEDRELPAFLRRSAD